MRKLPLVMLSMPYYAQKQQKKQTRKRNKQMIKKREKRKISCLAEKPTCF